MANGLIVAPLNAEFREYVRGQGIPCGGLSDGAVPTSELLTKVLRELGWPFSLSKRLSPSGETIWFADDAGSAGPQPPVQELTLLESRQGRHLSFRLGPPYGPWEVSWRVARVCGPQVAIEFSGGQAVVVTPDLDYARFHMALFDCPPGERDQEWS